MLQLVLAPVGSSVQACALEKNVVVMALTAMTTTFFSFASNFCCCFGREKQKTMDVSGSLQEGETGGSSDCGYAIAKHDRQKMEDRICAQEDVAGWRLFAVFDDHAARRRLQASFVSQKSTIAQLEMRLTLWFWHRGSS